MRSELIWFLGGSSLAVSAILAALCRNARRWLAAAAPPLLGLGAVVGWLGLTATPLNLFHVAALPLVIGMGVGFGIFQASRRRAELSLATDRAMLTTGLSTLGGFGALALASHPALHAMGLTVLLGVGVALVAAFLVPSRLAGDEA
jgi:predicted exporter